MMKTVLSNLLRSFAMLVVLTIMLLCVTRYARAQTGAVWVDTNGNVVGPALGNDMILLKIPSVGNIVLPVDERILDSFPIRYRYSFDNWFFVPKFPIVMSFESADCSGQGYAPVFDAKIGNSVLASDYFDSVKKWLVVAENIEVLPIPHFSSQLIQGDSGFYIGPGAYCQTVDVMQFFPVGRVTAVIDEATVASPDLMLQ